MYTYQRPKELVPGHQPRRLSTMAYPQDMFSQDTTLFKDNFTVQQWISTGVPQPGPSPDTIRDLASMNQAILDESFPQLYSAHQGSAWGFDADLYNSDITADIAFQAGSTSSDDGSIIGDHRLDRSTAIDMAHPDSHRSPGCKASWLGNGTFPAYYADQLTSASYNVSVSSSPCSVSPAPIFDSNFKVPGYSSDTTSPLIRPGSGASRIDSDISSQDGMLPAAIAEYPLPSPSDYCHSDLVFNDAIGSLQDDGSSYVATQATIRPKQDQTRPYITDTTFWPQSLDMTMALDPIVFGIHHGTNVSPNATAREHPLYHVDPNPVDNLYHCPFGPSDGCKHKADKLKCNYDKHLDSHLKPYRCKHQACSAVPFSSTACLLRHEREAHGMHGHGSNPFRCHYPECDRGRGFPRRYNLEDHMRRMHGFEPSLNGRRKAHIEDESKASVTRTSKQKAGSNVLGATKSKSSRITKSSTARPNLSLVDNKQKLAAIQRAVINAI